MNAAQCSGAAWMGGEFEGGWEYAYAWLSPSPCSPETSTTLLISYTPVQNKKFLKNSCVACFWKGGWEVRKGKQRGGSEGGRGTKGVRDRGKEEGLG